MGKFDAGDRSADMIKVRDITVCPYCDGINVEVPTIDTEVGEVQCGPAFCIDCGAYQDGEDPARWYEGVAKAPSQTPPFPPHAKTGL